MTGRGTELLYGLRRWFGANELLYGSYLRVIGRHELFPSRETCLLIDGYPRSANTFAYYLCREVVGERPFSHHIHNIASLKAALRYSVPSLILVRDPRDAVVSLAQKKGISPSNSQLISELIRRWLTLYNFSIDHFPSHSFIRFEEVINEPDRLVRRIGSTIGLPIARKDACDLAETAVAKINEREKEKPKLGGSLPSESRSRQKGAYHMAIEASNWYKPANLLYEQLRACGQN